MRWLRPTFQADAATITIEEFDNLRSVSWPPQVVPGREHNEQAAVSSLHLPLRPRAESISLTSRGAFELPAPRQPKKVLGRG